MLSICSFTTSFPRSEDDDAGIFVKRLYQAFEPEKAKIQVIVPIDNQEPLKEQVDQILVHRFKYGIFTKGNLAFGSGIMPNIRKNPFLTLQAPALLLGFAIKAYEHRKTLSLIHCNWAITGLPAFVVWLLIRKPYVITLRGEDIRLIKSLFFHIILQPVFKYSKAVTCVNQGDLESVLSNYPFLKGRIQCISNGTSLRSVTPEETIKTLNKLGLKESEKIAVFVGSIIPRKRVETLIEAFSSPELKDWKLLLIGRSNHEDYFLKLKSLINDNPSKERIIFTGQIAPEDIAIYLDLASLYVSASEHEGRPNSVLEAKAAGLSMLLSDINAHKEMASDSPDCLFRLGDAEHLKTKVIGFSDLQTSPLSSRIKTWQESSNQYTELFLKICNGQ